MKRLLLVLLVSCDAPSASSSTCQLPDSDNITEWMDACVAAIGDMTVTGCCDAGDGFDSHHIVPSSAEELCTRLGNSTMYTPVEVLAVQAIAACVERSDGNACLTSSSICDGYLHHGGLSPTECGAFPPAF